MASSNFGAMPSETAGLFPKPLQERADAFPPIRWDERDEVRHLVGVHLCYTGDRPLSIEASPVRTKNKSAR
jgi:hypothetical protein